MKENEMRVTITIPREAFGDISPELLAKLFERAGAVTPEVIVDQTRHKS